jgi:hypothetical protein
MDKSAPVKSVMKWVKLHPTEQSPRSVKLRSGGRIAPHGA